MLKQALRFCVIGSGSGGNSSVLRRGEDAMLIDAGFGPLSTAKRLRGSHLQTRDLRALCLTHLDQDHFRPTWVNTLHASRSRLFVHHWHEPDLRRVPGVEQLFGAGLVSFFDGEPFEPLPGLCFTPVRLPHDTKGTVGFHVESDAGCMGYATDLGHVPAELVERFADVDVLAIESNYDPPMQQGSDRPVFLKRRITGGSGHLSNQQSFDAVRAIRGRSRSGRPGRIVLLHRSSQCNRPELVREVFAQDADIAARVVLSEQRRRTPWMEVSSGERALQMDIDFGAA